MAFYVVELARPLVANGLYKDVLDEHYQELLYESAPLHDIGKVGIPDALLNKPGKLTESEFKKEVKEILAGLAGSHFDPDLIQAFMSCESKFKNFAGV